MADGDRPTLAVADRSERGTRANKRLRREGFVPGVVYGGSDGESHSFKVGTRELRHVLVDGSALIDVTIDGAKSLPVIIKDVQHHPVRNEVVHIDFLQVRLDQTIQSQVQVHVEGADDAPGVREGGVLEHVTHQLNIEALPTDIPESITVDVSSMEIAATLTLAEIPAPKGVTFLDDLEETVIASVVVPTEVEDTSEGVEEETALVGEEGQAPAADAEASSEGDGDADAESAEG